MKQMSEILSNSSAIDVAAACIFLLSILVLLLFWKKRKEVYDLNRETEALNQRLLDLPPELEVERNLSMIIETKRKISEGREIHEKIKLDAQSLNPVVEMIQAGLYPPTFTFLDSEDLKEAIKSERLSQLELAKAGKAVSSIGTFTLFDSQKDGKALVKDYKRVFLRTFNAEFEDVRKKLRLSNVDSSREKVFRSAEKLEKLGEVLDVKISAKYLSAKIQELDAWVDDLTRRHEAKERRKEQQKLLRLEKKKFTKDDEELEKELEISITVVNKAKKRALELVGMTGADVEREMKVLEQQISEHEKRIEESRSEAQRTKAGYIYVISNIGSFGKGILKIGMTRRLEPMDRVVELGDASVPYRFDVHTIAFVNNAPEIERRLHKHFDEFRVNKDNERKEFFEVAVDDVRQILESYEVVSDWYYATEAREYNESELMRQVKNQSANEIALTAYPEAI